MAKIRRVVGILLLVTSFLITQAPGYETNAASLADFQINNGKLVKYAGTASTVSIPAGVKTIGAEAFAENTTITSVSIGTEVKEIEYGAFRDCTNLKTVVLSKSLESIGNGAFSNNTSLKTITLPANVKNLGAGVFAGCTNLTSIIVDKNNPYYVVEEGVLCSKDKKILYCYPEGLKSSQYTMPSTVIKVNDYAFWGNDTLEKIDLSGSLYEISDYAFSNCKALTSLAIPYSVGSIDIRAFENCVSLKEVSIPSSVGFIHSTAFDGCYQLEIIADAGTVGDEFYQTWKRRNPDRTANNTASGSTVSSNTTDVNSAGDTGTTDVQPQDNGRVYVVGGNSQVSVVDKGENTSTGTTTSPAAQSTSNSSQTSTSAMHHPSNVDYVPLEDPLAVNEQGVLGKTIIVGGNAVVLMDSSQKVVSGMSYREVTQEEELEAIQSFVDGDKGTALPKYAVIGDKITAHAYYGDTSLSAYTISSGIKSIGEFAFARSSITSVNIPEGVQEIGYAAFYHCDYLSEVSIPSTVTWIEPSAFTHTAWLNNWGNDTAAGDFLIVGDGILLAYKGNSQVVEIPQGVKTIAPSVFMAHGEMQSVILPESLEVIGEEAFQDCSSLAVVEGGSSLREIQDRAFQNTGITQITIGDKVEKIGVAAFAVEDTATERTVIFSGNTLPQLMFTDRTSRVSNSSSRKPAFYGNWKAVVADRNVNTQGTILEGGTLGFTGKIVSLDSSGNEVMVGNLAYTGESNTGVKVTSSIPEWEASRISASLPYEGTFHLAIKEGDSSQMTQAFRRIYGGAVPMMMVFDMTMTEGTDSINLTRFGSRPLEVTVPLPTNISGSDLHVVALDEDGQMELLSSSVIRQVNEGTYVRFTTTHLSTFAIYAMGENDSRIIEDGNVTYTAVSGKKDYTPNTGDNSIHPKWFAAVGVGAIAMIIISYGPRKKKR